MIIQTSTNIAKVNEKLAPKIESLVRDDGHHIVASGELSKALGVEIKSPVSIISGIALHPVTSENSDLTAGQESEVKEALDNFKKNILPLLKTHDPEFKSQIVGVDLVFAVENTFKAFTDEKNDSKVKPWLEATKALMKLIDVIDPIFPQIKKIPYFDAIGVIVSTGSAAYQIYSDVSKNDPETTSETDRKSFSEN